MLEAMEESSSKKKSGDRLDTVSSMILALNAIDRSIYGWRSWVQSLRLMSRFTEDELRDMEERLRKMACAFVEYDIEVTKKHVNKLPRITVAMRNKKENEESRGIYV